MWQVLYICWWLCVGTPKCNLQVDIVIQHGERTQLWCLMPNFTEERTQTSVLKDDRKEGGQQHHVSELALAMIHTHSSCLCSCHLHTLTHVVSKRWKNKQDTFIITALNYTDSQSPHKCEWLIMKIISPTCRIVHSSQSPVLNIVWSF